MALFAVAAKTQEETQLELEVAQYRAATFADSTKSTYRAQFKVYMQFCMHHGYMPVPITSDKLCMYAAFLARTRKFSTVRQYLNVVRILHLESGFPNPLLDNWFLRSVRLGIQRVKGDSLVQKLPITPEILLKVRLVLNLADPADAMFWAVSLTAFFGLFRKGDLLLANMRQFDKSKHLRRRDICLGPLGATIHLRHSKTIQNSERVLHVPIPILSGHPLCPVQAIIQVFSMHKPHSLDAPAYSLPPVVGSSILSQSMFSKKLSKVLNSIGIQSSRYSGHSFRRGGASWALQCGFPSDIIRMMGDWKSDAYRRYLDMPFASHVQFAKAFGAALPKQAK